MNLKPLFELNREAVNVRRGLLAVAIIAAAIALFLVVGPLGLTAALGALIISMTDFGGPLPNRLKLMVGLTVSGSVLTLLGTAVGNSSWPAVVALFVITFICGLGFGGGQRAAILLFLLNLWLVIAQSLSALGPPLQTAFGFALGGCAVMLLAALTSWWQRRRTPDDDTLDQPLAGAPPGTPWRQLLASNLKPGSPWFIFALVRAVAVTLAMAAGILFFAEYPLWAAISTLIVISPDVNKAVPLGVQRAIGTALGAGLALLAGIVIGPGHTWLVVALFLLGGFAMIALQYVNYILFATLMTFTLLAMFGLIREDLMAVGQNRVAATIVGILLAVAAVTLLKLLSDRLNAAESEAHP
ncbi:MAG: hypothetical protein Kow0031_36650 [Anaerolineae bacterium]